jgi:hypothetical protein
MSLTRMTTASPSSTLKSNGCVPAATSSSARLRLCTQQAGCPWPKYRYGQLSGCTSRSIPGTTIRNRARGWTTKEGLSGRSTDEQRVNNSKVRCGEAPNRVRIPANGHGTMRGYRPAFASRSCRKANLFCGINLAPLGRCIYSTHIGVAETGMTRKETERCMAWATPVLVEICIGLEINGYLPAEF